MKSLHFKTLIIAFSILAATTSILRAEDGYQLWLRYKLIADAAKLKEYQQQVSGVVMQGQSPTLAVAGQELTNALTGLLGTNIYLTQKVKAGSIVAGTPDNSELIQELGLKDNLKNCGPENRSKKIEQQKNLRYRPGRLNRQIRRPAPWKIYLLRLSKRKNNHLPLSWLV